MSGLRYCICHDCGWRGGRRELANRRPCPRCKGKVYLPNLPPRKPRVLIERARLQAWVPAPWVAALKADPKVKPGARVRLLVAEYLKIDHDDYMRRKKPPREP